MEKIKLAKFLAACGITSRRKAEGLIKNGKISVNGELVLNVAERVDPKKDKVLAYGKNIQKKNFVYYLLYKPTGYITTTSDKHAEKIVTELVPKSPPVWPVGRLDKNTSGILILTNDGALTQKITHPSNKIEKEYSIITNFPLSEEEISKVKKGVKLDDGLVKPEVFEKVSDKNYKIVLTEGRKRIVRRIIETTGKRVSQLKRLRIGKLKIEKMKIGSCRKLTIEETTKFLFQE